jgi:hypothetical protein
VTRLVAATVLLLGALVGCSGDDQSSADPTATTATPSVSASPSAAPRTATAVPPPANDACYDLSYDEAVAPTVTAEPVDCRRRHTAATFAVGRLDTVVHGHLLAVDSDRVRAQVADTCPTQLASFVGGTLADRRLSMLRAVWFTPTVEESDAGASWYRCDVVALARDAELAPLTGRLAGVLGTPEGADRYGMCGTAQPGTEGFDRVVCSREHSWRAVEVVPFADGPYPGAERVRAAGETPCEDAGAAAAGDSLDYQWGYEWPSAAQWADGQHYGRCWVPN